MCLCKPEIPGLWGDSFANPGTGELVEHPRAERTGSLSDCPEVLESDRVGRVFSSINILFTPIL